MDPPGGKRYLDFAAYAALRVAAMFIQMLRWHGMRPAARWIGDMLYRFDHRHRRRAIEHLHACFPDWSQEACGRVARESMRNMIYLALEILLTRRYVTLARWRRTMALHDVGPAMRLMLRHETGIIYVTGHFGNFELPGYALAMLGFPGAAVARPLDNPYIWRYLTDILESSGQRLLYKWGAVRAVDAILTRGDAVSFVADQDAGRSGIFVDFFGRPASTYKAIGLAAMSHGVPIVVGYGRRAGEDFRFDVGVQRIIHPHEWADKDDPLRWITQEYTKALEEVIRTAPAQYLWSYRRWKTQPRKPKSAPGTDDR